MADSAAPPALRPLAEAPAELEIRKGSWKKDTIDLVDGGTSFARIDYATWSGKAKADTAGGCFSFSRAKGLVHGHIEVARDDGGEPFAQLDLERWHRGGDVDLDGTSYTIAASGFWKSRWHCERGGEELFSVTPKSSFGKDKGDVAITDAGRQDANLGLLLLLTMHANHSYTQNQGALMATNASVVVAS